MQTLIALSSGEAEYDALILGARPSLGSLSHNQNWMTELPIDNFSDGSAAWSVVRRRGIGGYLRPPDTTLVVAQPSCSDICEV